ncbi:MAG: DUF3881 family protein [Defluviitaleaceae bacterium]|nr:DUF3881 family protein [Defluviitaleaceae bacterium]
MDVFMRSVGFTRVKFFENINQIKKEIAQSPDKRIVLGYGSEGLFVECYKLYGNGIGILARGVMDDKDVVTIESCEAFAVSEDIYINKYVVEFAKNHPLIVFEDIYTNNELVFALQNRIDYIKDEQKFINHGRSVTYSKDMGIIKRKVNYTAFSVYGSIILPVYKTDDDEDFSGWDEDDTDFAPKTLRFGENEDDALNLIQTYAEVIVQDIEERLLDEDLLSVVEGFFLPMDENETDYSLLGEIEAVEHIQNEYTKEKVVRLSLNVTGTKLALVINKRDLIGHPSVGMRFMGTCRLRGTVII